MKHQGFACAAYTIGDEKLVDLLEFGGRQTIESVFEIDIARGAPLTHAAGERAPGTR
jgi:hypothetical protein